MRSWAPHRVPCRRWSRHATCSSSSSQACALGIDLGTTTSSVAIIGADGKPELLPIHGSLLVPSVVTCSKVGGLGRRQAVLIDLSLSPVWLQPLQHPPPQSGKLELGCTGPDSDPDVLVFRSFKRILGQRCAESA